MKVNLALYIFLELVRVQRHEQGRAVSLSEMRQVYNIPETTFYRHVKSLIDNDLIIRLGRDKYSVSHVLMSDMIPLSLTFPLQGKLL
jgi:DNA-binding IclR family transcriptional regulator